MSEFGWKDTYNTDKILERLLRESFRYKMPLREERVLEIIKSESQFDYV